MAVSGTQPDVLVLGEHPCALLAAAILRGKGKLKVLHATIPGDEPPDRLVLINPELFRLHELTKPLQRKVELTPVHGIRFLGEAADTASEHRSKTSEAAVARYSHLREQFNGLAQKEGVESISTRTLDVRSVDEKGVELSIDGEALRPRMLIVAGELPVNQRKILAIPAEWEPELLHRYTFVRWRSETKPAADGSAKPTMPMSLNVAGTYAWAWFYAHDGEVQLSCSAAGVSASANGDEGRAPDGRQLLQAWADTLKRHGVLPEAADVPVNDAQSMDIPLGGALAHEGVASRMLLIGPAGGFYSACAEDIYPNCWSAIYAADVARKSLAEPHLQDALNAYRHRWRTTLGDYLRGPQQNLRFLLSLVYKNPVMTTRIAEAILTGKSVVR